MEIGPPVLVKKIFEAFFTIYGRSSELGYVTSIMLMDFHSLYLKAYMQNLYKNGQVVS